MASVNNLEKQDTGSGGYLDDDFKQWVQSLMEEFHVPGLSVAVVHNGQVTASGYGLAQLPDVPATANTIYSMGSTTKQFTAALLGLLIKDSTQSHTAEDNDDQPDALSWSTPVVSILKDDFALSDPYLTDNVSIEDMLSHRTGIPGHDLMLGPRLSTPLESTRILKHLKHLKANAPFRTRFQYSNLIYGVIGHVIEVLAGQTFSTVIRKRIFEPLGMTSTFMGPREATEALDGDQSGALRFARGYCWISEDPRTPEYVSLTDKKKGYYVADLHTNLEPLDPAGATMSNVLDYAKWVSELLKSSVGPPDDKNRNNGSSKDDKTSQLISDVLWKELTTPRTFWLPAGPSFPQVYAPRSNTHVDVQTYALGLYNDPYMYPGEATIAHGGRLPCFGSLVHMVPNLKFGVIVAANTSGSSNILCSCIAKELVGHRLGLSKEERRHRHDDKTKAESKDESKPQPNASKPNFVQESLKLTDGPIASDRISQLDASSIFYMSDQPILLAQRFLNPAYGTYIVSLAPKEMSWTYPDPVYKEAPIIRNIPRTIAAHDKETIKNGAHVIHIRPVNTLSIICEFLLHPSAVGANRIVYDLEIIERHGLSRPDRGDDPDPFPNLPPGHGRAGDEKYPYQHTQVWMSSSVKMSGGVLVLSEDDRDETTKTLVVEKIGLRLARVDEAKDATSGVLQKRWAETMEWFVPEE